MSQFGGKHDILEAHIEFLERRVDRLDRRIKSIEDNAYYADMTNRVIMIIYGITFVLLAGRAIYIIKK